VFDIFNRILMKKGVIMNKLNIYKRTIVIVQILYKYLTDKESLSLLKDYRFIILFTERFSNVLNINPAHTALVLVPPREMIIYSKYSPFDNEYFVKYYVNKILTTMNMSIFIPDFLRTKVLNEVKKVLFKNVPEKYVSIILKNISKAKENIVVKPRSVPVPVPVPLVSVPTTETVTEPVNITGSLSVICISPIILILPSIEEEETKEEFLTGTLEFINILKPKPKPKVQKEVNEFFFFSG
jgi:hypothetical protein